MICEPYNIAERLGVPVEVILNFTQREYDATKAEMIEEEQRKKSKSKGKQTLDRTDKPKSI